MSLRSDIERNAIALLSNHEFQNAAIDPPSSAWLGRWASNKAIQLSGLWNVNHVTENYRAEFLDVLQAVVLR